MSDDLELYAPNPTSATVSPPEEGVERTSGRP